MKGKLSFIVAMLLLSLTGCQYIKDKVIIEEEVVEEEEVVIPMPTAEEIVLPKISGINYFGKNTIDNGSKFSMEIGALELNKDALYLGFNIVNKTSGTITSTKIIELPNTGGQYYDETLGIQWELDFNKVNQILPLTDTRILVAGSDKNNMMKLQAYDTITKEPLWDINMKRTVDIGEGETADVVKTSDGKYVYIGNSKDAKGKYYGQIGKIDNAGNIIWNSDLVLDTTDLILDHVVEGEDPDTFLVIGHIYEDVGYKVFRIQKGTMLSSVDLNYITETIEKTTDGNYFIMGVNKKVSNEPFEYMDYDTYPIVTKIDGQLNELYQFNRKDINRFTDFIELSPSTYLFTGSFEQDGLLSVYHDTGEELMLIEEEYHSGLGIIEQVEKTEETGEALMLSGYKVREAHGTVNRYAWVSYLYPLNPTLEAMYVNMLNNDGDVRYLRRGEPSRREMALAIAAVEGHDNLMFIRYMKSDENYSFVVTGQWDNPQIVKQYFLKKENGQWTVLESFEPTEKAIEPILLKYPDVPTAILPPAEMSEFTIKVLDDTQIQEFLNRALPGTSASHVTYCSYIDDYFYVLFSDDSDYLIMKPEQEAPEVYEVSPIDAYNLHLLDGEKPAYMLFLQD